MNFEKMGFALALLFIVTVYSCQTSQKRNSKASIARNNEFRTFSDDYKFLKKYTDIVILRSADGLVAVSPALQGRVMTSSANGMKGASYGWINRALFKSGDTLLHINPYGGEERFWLGPEGGQFSLFFKKGEDFIFKNWNTPRLIDLEPFQVKEYTPGRVSFEKVAKLTNYSGSVFDFKIDRTISILSRKEINDALNMLIPEMTDAVGVPNPEGVSSVAFKSINVLTNIGNRDWKKETGLLSIWLLGMFNHSETTTIIIPYKHGEEADLGRIVNDDYFGKVPAERLVVSDKAIFFKGDGKHRGKIGLNPQRAGNVFGSYNASAKALTILIYNKPEGVTDYVNSKWEWQDEPFQGDVINSYNDGPAEPGAKPMGPFYELETSSPAAELITGESLIHIQTTYHFEGNELSLDKISQKLLGVSLNEISQAFKN